MSRSQRLTITAQGIVLEAGIGIRHSISWDDCDAVLRFADRAEVILDPTTSVIIRARDWYRGDEALQLIERVLSAGLLVTLPGEAEVDPTPYRLSGLATSSSVVHALMIATTLFFGSLLVAAGTSDPNPGAQLVGVALCALALPFMFALKRRLAVPRRWRQTAVVASRRQVRLDHRLSRLSDRQVALAIIGCPVAGVLVTVCIGLLTHRTGGLFVGLGISLGLAANVERMRRQRR